MSLRVLVLLSLATLGACRCGPLLPSPPKQCTADGLGCLSDEVCVDSKCQPRPKCESAEDCASPAFECVLPAQVCVLREGFGQECSAAAPCAPGLFCALGICRTPDPEDACNNSSQCPPGERCADGIFYCIPDADCRLAPDFPELACLEEIGESCDALTGQCALKCDEPVCTSDDECPFNGERCGAGGCRCVQCLNDDDCGPGTSCDTRSGDCRSDNACFKDDDCEPPLVCNRVTNVCEVPPPPCESDFDCALGFACNIVTTQCEAINGACTGDQHDAHNTPATAEPLIVASGINPALEATLCPNADDVYSVLLGEGDLLIATLETESPAARATIFLLDETGETSIDFAEAPPRGNGRVAVIAQHDETVYLRLSALIASTDYALTVNKQAGAVCQADAFEPNDDLLSPTDPSRVPDGVNLVGAVCPGDVDLYRVHVAPGEALTARVTFDPGRTDLDLAFLDPSGTLLAQSSGTQAPEQLRRRFVAAQDVLVRVKGFGNKTGDYTLQVTHEPPFACVADASEPGDGDIATAPVVALNQELGPEDRTICEGDQDLIALPLEDFERVIVSTQYQEGDVKLAVDILDADGATVLATSPPAFGGAAVSFDSTAPIGAPVTYFARVRGVGGATGAYTLRVEKENKLDCTPDAREPNNTVGTRSSLPAPGELLSICDNDQDFFAIDGNADKKLVIDASFRQDQGDIDLILLGLDGQQILASADGTGDGEHLEFTLPLDGTYTLRVFSLTSGAKSRYSLSVQEVAP